MAIEWRKSYEIGVEKIDSQHKELFIKINNLLEACSTHKGKEEVLSTIDFLGDYVITHFSDEEKLQKDNEYPDYKDHKSAHERFVKDYEKLKEKLDEEGISLNFVMTVNKVVVDWLVKHIASADRAFGTFLKSKV
ncbi:bacteriohemerythrin [Acetivibrio cellulolyticus]|uniref:bacteriohemerythrin n=1 Tax=Acetivibrio cellulolyticus TaxID=35830 RepID=UPI0001E2D947|nr:bacteriohemerythrin [Acetivibrio cellulolyticus]